MDTPPKRSRTFISELKVQLDVIDAAIQRIYNRGTTDAWGTKIKPDDAPELANLKARRKVVERKIIEHDP